MSLKVNYPQKFRTLLVAILLTLTGVSACDIIRYTAENLEESLVVLPLSETEIIKGLKEALYVGAKTSVSITNQVDGYYGNPQIKIPWPTEAQGAYNFISNNLEVVQPLLDEVVLKMNRGAEEASARAQPIFLNAIMEMSIIDARNILNGEKNAATQYLFEKTYSDLHAAFKPEIYNSLESVGAATVWTNITSYYNPIARFTPGINPINTDLADYTTTEALNGLFLLIEEEEMKIRTDPAARVNDILRRVFGSID
jgi:hypothetical protein